MVSVSGMQFQVSAGAVVKDPSGDRQQSLVPLDPMWRNYWQGWINRHWRSLGADFTFFFVKFNGMMIPRLYQLYSIDFNCV